MMCHALNDFGSAGIRSRRLSTGFPTVPNWYRKMLVRWRRHWNKILADTSSVSAIFSYLFTHALQRSLFESGYLSLRNADLLGDLYLGLVFVKPKVNDGALALG